ITNKSFNKNLLKDVIFATLMAEDLSEISMKYSIAAVPSFLLIREGKVLDRVEGANAAELTTKVKTQFMHIFFGYSSPFNAIITHNPKLSVLVLSAQLFMYLLNTIDTHFHGFSRTTIELLTKHKADYSTFDILTDDSVRQGLKTYSNWPTYPQLYIDGELIGGLDILKEMDASKELGPMLPKKQNLDDRLQGLVNKAPLMVFMKGDPETPKCGFSRTLIEMLKETGLSYETFDILTDEEVRQGLKTFSNWPTYPQVYVKGELAGGLDILKELKESGELVSTLKGE
ncbi:unnamed protein product, partial [Meganyctiphanes norvegica]